MCEWVGGVCVCVRDSMHVCVLGKHGCVCGWAGCVYLYVLPMCIIVFTVHVNVYVCVCVCMSVCKYQCVCTHNY